MLGGRLLLLGAELKFRGSLTTESGTAAAAKLDFARSLQLLSPILTPPRGKNKMHNYLSMSSTINK
jgi:hypothetical protein